VKSSERAAQICGCAVGTIKSRVNRARGRLAEILSIEDASDLGADSATRTVVNSSLSAGAAPILRRNATWYFSLIRNKSALAPRYLATVKIIYDRDASLSKRDVQCLGLNSIVFILDVWSYATLPPP
jgi:hypothetical protein